MSASVNQTDTSTVSKISTHESIYVFTDTVTLIIQWFIFAVLCQMINVFGVGTNIVNIICFLKQGFKDPINVSLIGLAVADIGCLVTLTWTNICFTPAVIKADLPFDSREFQYLTSGMPHAAFTRVTAWFTALITLERCMCITAPLKVKEIVTQKRVLVIFILVFVILTCSVAPLYVVNKLGRKFFPTKNKTLLGLIYAPNREKVEKMSFAINNVLVPFGAFVVIIVCTTILFIKLKTGAEWRKKSIANVQADKVSTRNEKVAKMVVMMSSLFIICFIPVNIIFLAMSLEPEMSLDGRYINLLTVIGGFGVIMESVNSTANIAIYYRMSSKYRYTLTELFSNTNNTRQPKIV